MSQRDEYRQLQRDHESLVSDHLNLVGNFHNLRDAHDRELRHLLNRTEHQEKLLNMADAMQRKLETGLAKVMSLVERHLAAGESHVPAKALWYVLRDAGFATNVELKQATKPEVSQTQKENITPELKPTQKPQQQQTPNMAMKI